MTVATLVDVATATANGDSFDRCLANFLDAFYATPLPAALLSEPKLLATQFGEKGKVQDAYLAATAEELARQFNFQCPSWTNADGRRLQRPWFASPLAGLRALLLLESPAAFRARNIFVSENALARA